MDIPAPRKRARSDEDPPPKDFGHYRNLEFIGEGGMSNVYRAHDSANHRLVALKFVRRRDPELILRLTMEARSQSRIEHKNLCKVYETGEIDGRLYIAMQYIPGLTLDKVAEKLSRDEKVKLILEVAEAIHVAHKANLIHRDLKPSNILVDRAENGEWVPYVVDFGLVREVAGRGMTATGILIGSPSYMSPEQALGEREKLDHRTDIYSLGTTLFELLTGALPFEGKTSVDVLVNVIKKEPPSLSKAVPDISPDLDAIVLKCLEKDPQRRYDSAKAFADDLRRYLDGKPVHARPVSARKRLLEKLRRNKTTTALILSALIGAIILLIMKFR